MDSDTVRTTPAPPSCTLLDPTETDTQSLPSTVWGDDQIHTEVPELSASERAAHFAQPLDLQPKLSVTFRHSGWARERRLIFESMYRTGQTFNRKREYSECGSHAYVLRNEDDRESFRIAGSACRDRFCLPCANERSHGIALNVIDQVIGKQVRFLTLTVRSTDESLDELLTKLYTAFQGLRRRRLWTKCVDGGVAFLEVKWNDAKSRWHPHFHILIQGRFLPYPQLKAAWLELTGDSTIIRIQFIPTATQVAKYVTKYASKPFNNTYVNRPDRLDEAIVTLKGRKLCVTFGTWRGVILARHIGEGTWEHVGSLQGIIVNAAHGDTYCQHIMRSLTDLDLTELYARAPPTEQPRQAAPTGDVQLDWFGVWQRAGLYAYPIDSG